MGTKQNHEVESGQQASAGDAAHQAPTLFDPAVGSQVSAAPFGVPHPIFRWHLGSYIIKHERTYGACDLSHRGEGTAGNRIS